jgi:uncharacterized protein YhaN
MRFQKLNLIATGPFTNCILDLSQGEHGLHLIYGPNEAGKSSCLRAISNFLFGFPHKNLDDFNHNSKNLRIAATLLGQDGVQTLTAVRRKTTKNSLRDQHDQETLDSTTLDNFLRGVDRDLFEMILGINHYRLREGGSQLIKGEGKLGELLFAAGVGMPSLSPLLNSLKKDQEVLVSSSKRAGDLIKLIKDYQKNQQDLNQVIGQIEEWNQTCQDKADAEREKNELSQRRNGARTLEDRLKRIRNASMTLTAYRENQTTYKNLSRFPILESAFAGQLSDAEKDLANSRTSKGIHADEKQKLENKLAELGDPDPLLQDREELLELQEQVGEYRNAEKNISAFQANLNQLQNERQTLKLDLGISETSEQNAEFFVKSEQKIQIAELGEQKNLLEQDLEHKRQNLEQTRLKLQQAKAKQEGLSPPTDLHPLQSSLRAASSKFKNESELKNLRENIPPDEQSLQQKISQLPLWQGSLVEFQKLPFPLTETVRQFREDFLKLKTGTDEITTRLSQLQQDRQTSIDELERLELAKNLPSEKDLSAARERRDLGWQVIRRQWKLNQTDEQGIQDFLQQGDLGNTLEGAFEPAMHQADRLADELKVHAQQVAQKSRLQADIIQYERQLRDAEQEKLQFQSSLLELDHRWNQLWAPLNIQPYKPAEMEDWLQQATPIREKFNQLVISKNNQQKLEEEVGLAREAIFKTIQAVHAEFNNPSSTLTELYEYLNGILNEKKENNDLHQRLADSIAELDAQLQSEEQRYSNLQSLYANLKKSWQEAMAQLHLPENASPNQAAKRLELLDQLRDNGLQIDKFNSELRRLQQFQKNFESQVSQLGRKHLPDQQGQPTLEIFKLLTDRLKQSERKEQNRHDWTEKAQELEEKIKQSLESEQKALNVLALMQRTAGVDAYDKLNQAIENSNQHQAARDKMEQSKQELMRFSNGLELGDFIAEIEQEQQNEHSLEVRIENLAEEIKKLDEEVNEATVRLTTSNERLTRFNGHDKGLEQNAQAREMAASIEDLYRRWSVLTISQGVLNRAIEEHREANQAPILKRAGQIFERITLGQYTGLRADYEEGDKPVLKGLRAGQPNGSAFDSLISVQGMSDGTCDQLYLALRLASLEDWLNRHEPLPFIVDDILINFDDERALATLEVLAEFSCRTQVIFFTHHIHLVQLAQERNIPNVFFHEL